MNSSMNEDHDCETLYHGKEYLTETHKYILITFNVVVIILNIVVNIKVIWILFRKRLLDNNSMRLIFFLSISDCCVALISQPMFILLLTKFTESCAFETATQFVILVPVHVSECIVVFIGYDRYCRIRYLNRYHEVVTSWKIIVAMVAAVLLAVLQALLDLIGTTFNVFEEINIISAVIDIITISIIVLTYITTVKVVKKHKQCSLNKNVLGNVDKQVTSMSQRILLALILLYTPYLFSTMMHHWIIDKSRGELRKNLNFFLFVGYGLIPLNSFANAVIFLTLNKKTRLKKSMLRKISTWRNQESYYMSSLKSKNDATMDANDHPLL